MLTARNVILLTLAIALISLASVVVSLMSPPDSGGLAGDSFGTRAHGQRALFETLVELGVRVERQMDPPRGELSPDTTLVFWRPHVNLVDIEPVHLHAVADWVRQGGRVVVAPDRSDNINPFSLQSASRLDEPRRNVLEELGLTGVSIDFIDLESPGDGDGEPDSPQAPSLQGLRRRSVAEDLESVGRLVTSDYKTTPLAEAAIRTTGSLSQLEGQVRQIQLPVRHVGVLDTGKAVPGGTITIAGPDGADKTLVAAFPLEAGEIVVVGSPEVAENRTLALGDNSVLMAHLLADSRRTVAFDEFYHGLTVRGNPLWLATRPGFGATALAIVLACAALIWRKAVVLGPPLAAAARSRRSIGEYVDAMSRFFYRGATSRSFVLAQVRDGALHAIRRELGLPPGREKVEELAAVVARRDPARAARLVEAVMRIDKTLSSHQPCRPADALRLLQGISNCL